MLKKHIAACLMATAFIAAPALAQTSTQPSGSASAPAASSPASSGQFLDKMQPDQWRASKLVGVVIYGQNNERIGDVNEVLIDRKGTADAVVIGVGGFLGIGEKDVALPFSAVEWKFDRSDLQAARPATDRPATTGTTSATGTTATTGTTAGTTAATDRSAMDRGYPDHGVVRFSKDDLKNAPTFRYSMTEAATAPARTTAPANPSAPATAPAPATPPKQ